MEDAVMRSELPFIDYAGFQARLDREFGVGVFTFVLGSGDPVQKFYIDYADNTPQTTVNLALDIANANAAELLANTKVRLYDEFEIYSKKLISLKTKPAFTADEINAANTWLQNQSTPPPSIVQYIMALKNLSALAAAQYIVDADTEYQQFIEQVNSVKNAGQAATLATTEFVECKIQAGPYLVQLKNIVP